MPEEPHPVATEETAEYAALYCLGDFAPEERNSYEEHLAACNVCRAEVDKYSTVMVELASAGSGKPSVKARKAFLGRIRADKEFREKWARISTVLITTQLSDRPTRKKNRQQITEALDELAEKLSHAEQEVLEASVRAALELCDAGTAGFSMLYEKEHVFRWDALAGKLAMAKGGTTPRAWSPCGTTLDLGAPQLFSHPARCFEYFSDAPCAIVEGLVVPAYVGGKPVGTLWVASHDEHKFDREDVQVLQRIANLCAIAVGVMRERQGERTA